MLEMERELVSFLSTKYQLSAVKLIKLRSFHDVNYHVIGDVSQYVLKMFNTSSEVSSSDLKKQFEMMWHLKEKGYQCSCPVRNRCGDFISSLEVKENKIDNKYLTVLLTFIPGMEVSRLVPLSCTLLNFIGSYIGMLRKDMKDICVEPSEDNANNLWVMENVAAIRKHFYVIQCESDRNMLEEVVAEFEIGVLPKLGSLEKGAIHGDLHDDNLIWLSPLPLTATGLTKDTPPQTVTPVNQTNRTEGTSINLTETTPLNPPDIATMVKPVNMFKPQSSHAEQDLKQVFGLIDFGDLCISRYIFELAISVAYMMMFSKRDDFIQAGAEVIQGYQNVRPLSEDELEVLYVSVCARYIQELVLSEVEAHGQEHPDNCSYLRCGFKAGWPQLRKLRSLGKDKVLGMWTGR